MTGVITITFLLEVNRAPFDLAEAESELITGYSTELGGFHFGLYYLGEYFHLFFFSLAINFYYGYRGIFSQDSFFHFDAAYHILNNRHPFKDFYSISGIFVDYLQATFFYFFGVNWFGYIFHAAAINCLLSIFSFVLFNTLGLSKTYSFLYSVGISIISYTSAGSPFVDYHGVIFSLLSIYLLIFFIIKKNNISLFFLPIFLFLSLRPNFNPIASSDR